MIIPPSSLEVINRRNTVRRRLHLRSVVPPNWSNWNPIIIVGKRRAINDQTAQSTEERRKDDYYLNDEFLFSRFLLLSFQVTESPETMTVGRYCLCSERC